ncbi:uncharacterized protein YeaO (DUF488 family) [Rhizobium leguminosarum]|nr:uncharacterized protein YeaO (DUF488 family) [Rhizobium leguminosarum]MDH6274559.1 uncharacterized protein YeaO (DUF488 family) [Rhizobium leguminosarum]
MQGVSKFQPLSTFFGFCPQRNQILRPPIRQALAFEPTAGGQMALHIKRIYEPKDDKDGARILVDRLWPRGLSKQDAAVDIWLKDIAPSPALRRWFGHDPAKWTEFQRRYRNELEKNPSAVEELKRQIGQADTTLLYAAKDVDHNHAVVLQRFIGKD